jgi:hypothetical protein
VSANDRRRVRLRAIALRATLSLRPTPPPIGIRPSVLLAMATPLQLPILLLRVGFSHPPHRDPAALIGVPETFAVTMADAPASAARCGVEPGICSPIVAPPPGELLR